MEEIAKGIWRLLPAWPWEWPEIRCDAMHHIASRHSRIAPFASSIGPSVLQYYQWRVDSGFSLSQTLVADGHSDCYVTTRLGEVAAELFI
ncbi:hypothetical protein HZ326_11513 [Fusarium oxysporum f. sp. albedinis]|nr:hypothetical protein HZ326_11513 [Fusarium oxysporum f. sp. albedinis]